jgi:hypothetical protein
MRTSIVAAFTAILLAACAGSKSEQLVEMKPTGQPGEAIGTRTTKVAVTVKAVDAAKRTLTVVGSDGKAETFKVPPEVKRFGEIAAGDQIVVEINQGLLLQYQAPGTPALEPAAAVVGAVANGSSTPGAAVAGGVQGTVTIVGIDSGYRVVTFQDPDGNQYKVKADPKVAIEKLKVGDRLMATYVETLAIGIEKAAAKQ